MCVWGGHMLHVFMWEPLRLCGGRKCMPNISLSCSTLYVSKDKFTRLAKPACFGEPLSLCPLTWDYRLYKCWGSKLLPPLSQVLSPAPHFKLHLECDVSLKATSEKQNKTKTGACNWRKRSSRQGRGCSLHSFQRA